MASASRDDDETSGRHRFGCLHVELVAPPDVKRAGNHGEVPVGWVDVWGNVVPVGYLQAIRERHVGHGSITLEGGALGSARNRSGAVLPPHLVPPHHDGRLCYGGRSIRRLLARRPRKRERYGPGCHGPVVESVHGDGTSPIRVRPNGSRLSCGRRGGGGKGPARPAQARQLQAHVRQPPRLGVTGHCTGPITKIVLPKGSITSNVRAPHGSFFGGRG